MVKNNKKFRHDREAFAPEATPWLWEALGGGETRLRPEGYPPFNPRLPESIGGEAPEDSEVPQVYTDIVSLAMSEKGGSVPWHFHGEAFLTLLWGAKQWGLMAFGGLTADVRGSYLNTPGNWHDTVWPTLRDPEKKALTAPCVQVPGETMYVPPNYHHITRNLDFTFGLGEHHPEIHGSGGLNFFHPDAQAMYKEAVDKGDVLAMFFYARGMRDSELAHEREEASRVLERLVELDRTDMRAHGMLIKVAVEDGAPVAAVRALFHRAWDALDAGVAQGAPYDAAVRAKVTFLEDLVSEAGEEALLSEVALPLLERMLEDHPEPSKYAAPVLMVMANYEMHHSDRYGAGSKESMRAAEGAAGELAQRALECEPSGLLHDQELELLRRYRNHARRGGASGRGADADL